MLFWNNRLDTSFRFFLSFEIHIIFEDDRSIILSWNTFQEVSFNLPKNIVSGLKDALIILKNKSDIGIVRLDDKDVMRHPIVKKIIDSYNKNGIRK